MSIGRISIGETRKEVVNRAIIELQERVDATPASAPVVTPQGRLTLASGVQYMDTTQSAKTTLYYTPTSGDIIPLYDGTNYVPTPFSEISVATSDTAKNPAAIGASKVNHWFVWSDSGTLRLTHSVDWTNDTTEGAGATLVAVNGIKLNSVDIANGPLAQRGTWMGTTRSNASSQLDWILGGTGAGGVAAWLGVFNAYNPCDVAVFVGESTASWAYGGNFRAVNASNNNRVSYICGMVRDAIAASYSVTALTANAAVGIGIDSVTTASGSRGYLNNSAVTAMPVVGSYAGEMQLGFHFVQAVEWAISSSTFLGQDTSSGTLYLQSGLACMLRM